jgi:hypothetical protein
MSKTKTIFGWKVKSGSVFGRKVTVATKASKKTNKKPKK